MSAWDWASFKGSAEQLKYLRRDLADLEVPLSLVTHRRAVVQAGGNLGLYPKWLAQHFDVVYTFEIAPRHFPVMVRNAPEENIIRAQFALGCQRGRMVGVSYARRLGKGSDHEGMTHVEGTGIVPTQVLDDLCLPDVDLICLDVEGEELNALKGALGTIARCRPVLMVELNKNLELVGLDEATVRRFIEDLGYRLVRECHSDKVFVPVERAA